MWYHVQCLRLQTTAKYRRPPADSKIDEKKYYCTKACEENCKDKKFLYSKAFINAGLHFEGYRDSIRTNDGLRMNAYNKMHLIQFHNYKHSVYFKYSAIWLAMKEGWSKPNCAFDLLHNSTVNISGMFRYTR
jgi:hypothetical protein